MALRTERTATVVASDAESDLAVLAVEWDGLPEPLDVAPATGLEETLPVRMLGYPFGEALSLAAGKPAITIGTSAWRSKCGSWSFDSNDHHSSYSPR